MPFTPATLSPALWRRSASAAAVALLLSACGGGNDTAEPPPVSEPAAVELEALGTTERQALARANPDVAADSEHYIVTLNAAAVAEGERLAARAMGAGSPLTPQARAERAVQSVTARLMSATGGARVRLHFAHTMKGFAVAVPQAQAADFVERMQLDPAVARIEQDRIATVSVTSTAPTTPLMRVLDSRRWGLDRVDQLKLPLDNRYQNTLDGSGVNIYIVDTGVSPHDEFGTRLAADGFDAVGDGGGTLDCHGHGTHVAGTAAGQTAGLAPGAHVVPVRVLPCGGSGPSSTIISGMDWIAAHGQRPGVVNLSLGGGASTAMDEAVNRLVGAGFTVVVAAGNDNTDACRQSPARATSALTVAASDSNDNRASFSNYGRCVDLFAPGVQILSAGTASTSDATLKSGTSMASPHVAGTVALLLQERPKLTPAQVSQQLLSQTSAVVKNTAGAPNKLLFAGAGRKLVFPTPWDVHVATLTATTRLSGRTNWLASVTVTVNNEEGQPVKGARVSGQFSNRPTVMTCVTAAAGTCTLGSTPLPTTSTGVTFAVTALSGDALTYRPTDNLQTQVGAERPATR